MGIIISVLKLLLVVKRYQNIIWSAPLKMCIRDSGCTAHNVTIASTENIQMISDEGYVGLDKVLEKYRADLDISE